MLFQQHNSDIITGYIIASLIEVKQIVLCFSLVLDTSWLTSRLR